LSRLLSTSGRPDRWRLSVLPREALHSRPRAADEDGYRGDDAVDGKEIDDHALLDIAQLSSLAIDFLLVFWDLHHLRLQFTSGFLRCVDHDVWREVRKRRRRGSTPWSMRLICSSVFTFLCPFLGALNFFSGEARAEGKGDPQRAARGRWTLDRSHAM